MDLSPRRLAETVVLTLRGRIDHATAEEFRNALWPWLQTGGDGQATRFVLDLSGVEYISSAGLRVLMLATKYARSRGDALAVAELQPLVQEIFEISKFTLLFPVFSTVRQAVAAGSAAALAAFDAP
jgi:anti-anti-sigma factor